MNETQTNLHGIHREPVGMEGPKSFFYQPLPGSSILAVWVPGVENQDLLQQLNLT